MAFDIIRGMGSQADILLIQVPPLGIAGPALGPALLLSRIREKGFIGQFWDLNVDLYHRSFPDRLQWFEREVIFDRKDLFDQLKDQLLNDIVDDWVEKIISYSPRWLGISVFSTRSWPVTRMICERIREKSSAIKIMVGGGEPTSNISRSQEALDEGLIDCFISGEAELSILEVLAGENTQRSIRPAQLPHQEMANNPVPDYSDLDGSLYGVELAGGEKLRIHYIESSRGCVRKCTFCNVPFTRPGFRMRDPNRVIEEIRTIHQNFGTTHFCFVDNLINGSMKHLGILLNHLMDLQIEFQKQEINKWMDTKSYSSSSHELGWSGYMIVKPESQFPPKWFDKMKKSGCESLFVGIESGSEKVRLEMNKKMSDQELDYTLEQCARVGIGVVALLMVGYPTETEKDFQKTIEFLHKNQKYAGSTITSIVCSERVLIQEEVIEKIQKLCPIWFREDGEWETEFVTPEISSDRYRRLHEVALELGFQMRADYWMESS